MREWKQSFDVRHAALFRFVAEQGDITVVHSNSPNEVAVHATCSVDIEKHYAFSVSDSGGVLTLSVRRRSRFWQNAHDLHLTVFTRPLLSLEISTGAGQIEAARLNNDLRLATTAGDILVREHGGRLVATTGAGNIIATQLHAPATLAAGTGSVTVQDARKDLLVTCTVGDIRVRDAAGEVNASGGAGVLEVSLAAGNTNNATLRMEVGQVLLEVDPRVPKQCHLQVDIGSVQSTIETGVEGQGSSAGEHRRVSPIQVLSVWVGAGDLRISDLVLLAQ